MGTQGGLSGEDEGESNGLLVLDFGLGWNGGEVGKEEDVCSGAEVQVERIFWKVRRMKMISSLVFDVIGLRKRSRKDNWSLCRLMNPER